MREFISGGVAGAVLTVGVLAGLHMDAGKAVRTPQFENEVVKAWRTVVPAGSASDLHRHDHPRVVVALTTGRMDSVDDKGATVHNDWEAGHAYWLPAMALGAMHKDSNPGKSRWRLS